MACLTDRSFTPTQYRDSLPRPRGVCRFGIPTCPGCSPSTSPSGSLEDNDLSHVSLLANSHSPQSVELFCRALTPLLTARVSEANREQFKAEFLDFFLPRHLPQAPWLAKRYREWMEPRSPAMGTAIDSLLTLHIGEVSKDRRLLEEGQQLHAVAVQLLQKELILRDGISSDAVVGTIAVLAICSRLRRSEDTDRVHSEGLITVIGQRGPDAVQSSFARDVILNLLPRAARMAIDARCPFIFGTPEWQAVLKPFCNDPMKQYVLVACRLPNALHGADRIVRKGRGNVPNAQLMDALRELFDVEKSVKNWLLTWYEQIPYSPYRLVGVEERFPGFEDLLGHYPQTFPFKTAYDFRVSLHAMQHCWYWSFLLEIRRSVLDLSYVIPSQEGFLSMAAPADDQKLLQSECTELADDVCRTLPYIYSTPATRQFRTAVCSCVNRARRWYEKSNNGTKTGWCNTVVHKIEQEDVRTGVSREEASIDRIFSGWLMLMP